MSKKSELQFSLFFFFLEQMNTGFNTHGFNNSAGVLAQSLLRDNRLLLDEEFSDLLIKRTSEVLSELVQKRDKTLPHFITIFQLSFGCIDSTSFDNFKEKCWQYSTAMRGYSAMQTFIRNNTSSIASITGKPEEYIIKLADFLDAQSGYCTIRLIKTQLIAAAD